MLRSFKELRERVGDTSPKTVAVACAHDAHTLEAVLHAAGEGILRYILIGREADISPPTAWWTPQRTRMRLGLPSSW